MIFEGTVGSTGISIATVARARYVLVSLTSIAITECALPEGIKPVSRQREDPDT